MQTNEVNTADNIMDVAQEMIQMRGFHGFSYRDLSERVGIRTASIHYYFPTKGDLGVAVLDRVLKGFAGALSDIERNDSSDSEKLKQFTQIFLDTFGEGDRLCPFCMMAAGQDTVPIEVKNQVIEFWTRGEKWLMKILASGQANGQFFLHAEPQTVARMIISTMEGAMVTSRAFEDERRLKDTAEYLHNIIKAD